MFTADNLHHSLFLLMLLVLCSCASTYELKPVEQEPIDESIYIDPQTRPDILDFYIPPQSETEEILFTYDVTEDLLDEGVKGTLVLRLYINETGEVDYAAIEESVAPVIDYSVQRSILERSFIPGRLHGQPVKSVIRFKHDFEFYGVKVYQRINLQ